MSVTSDGKFNFYDVDLVSKNGKFYVQLANNKSRVKRVPEDLFKMMLVSAYTVNAQGLENPRQANTFDYLLDQLDMTEDVFTALLYPEWINENKE